MDSAGSAKQEIELPGIDLIKVDEIKSLIYTNKKQNNSEKLSIEDEIKTSTTILKYNFKDYILIGITSSRMLVALAGLIAFYDTLQENISSIFGIDISDQINDASEFLHFDIITISIIFLVIIIFYLTLSIFGAIFTFFDFKINHENNKFHKSAGLLTKKEEMLSEVKIQSIIVRQSIINKLFKRFTIKVKQASSSMGEQQHETFFIPLCKYSLINQIVYYFNDDLKQMTFNKINMKYLFKYSLNLVIIPTVIFFSALFYFVSFWAFLILLYSMFSFLIIFICYHKWGYSYKDDIFIIKQGFLGVRYVFIEPYKIQSIKFKQSMYQRRNKLANLEIIMASGSYEVKYLTIDVASRLFNELKEKCQTSKKRWF